MIDDLLRIHEAALELDFEPADPQSENGHILPQTVLRILTEKFNADGGNLSIFDTQTNTLDVRAHHMVRADESIFVAFKRKMIEIGHNPDLRKLSSSYRSLDRGASILIPNSEIGVAEKSTLDISTLSAKSGLSSLAVPLWFHGQKIGIIHMDKNDLSGTAFDDPDKIFLERVAKLLAPIVFNSLFVESIASISSTIFDQKQNQSKEKLIHVCREISKILFIPWVGIYTKNKSIHEYSLQAFNDEHLLSEQTINQIGSLRENKFDEIQEFLDAQNHFELRNAFANCAEIDQKRPTYICSLRDIQNNIFGFIILSGYFGQVLSKPMINISKFISNHVGINFSTLSSFEDQSVEKYEVAAHEFVRNLNALNTNISRIKGMTAPYLRQNDRMQQDQRGVFVDVGLLNDLQRIIPVLEANVSTSSRTLGHILSDEKYDDYRARLPGADDFLKFPGLRDAKNRHEIYHGDQSPRPLRLRRAIEDILNSYNVPMSKKSVRWDRIYDQNMSPTVEVEPHNFEIIFGNLVDNAVKYAKDGTMIKFEAVSHDLEVEIRLTNVGPHIDIARFEGSDIFVKGVRGDYGKRLGPGLGLGLWEADQIARLWGEGGPIRLIHSEPLGIGEHWASVCFELRVPIGRRRWYGKQRGHV